MNPLRVAVIGVGHLGQHHARNYHELDGCKLVGICDVDRKAAARFAGMYRAEAFSDYRELIGKIDAASIVVPTIYHHGVASEFLKAGIHVLVEKPITTTVEQARDLIDLAAQKNLILQVGHIERFNVAVVKLREILNRPGFIECHRMGPYTPRVKDVGVVLDLMIHDIDIILQIVQSPVVSVDAVGVPILSAKCEDIANARIKFENGCTANLTVSRVSPTKMRKIRIFQSDAYISLDYADQSIEIYTREPIENPSPDEPPAQIVRHKVKVKPEEPLKAELAHFIDCVRNGREPQVTGKHGHDALEIAVEVTEQIRGKIDTFWGGLVPPGPTP